MSDAQIRVLCVDDHVVVLRGLVAILSQESDVSVVSCVTTANEGLEQYRRHRPDVTLMDLQLPGMTGLDAIRAIRQIDEDARILVLTMHHGSEHIRRALQAGASGYLLKDTLADKLIQSIRDVHAGRTALGAEASATLGGDHDPALTRREVDVIQMLAKGMRDKEIGASLGISEETVHAHMRAVFAKLHVHDRTLALAVAVRRGIVQLT